MTNKMSLRPPWTDRRIAAAHMLVAGHPIARVAAELGLRRVTARRYQEIFEAEGAGGLLGLREVGRRRLLTPDALRQIARDLRQSPTQYGFEGPGWTNETVRAYIERTHGVVYSHSHVNRLIRDLGLQSSML
jgi:transposase